MRNSDKTPKGFWIEAKLDTGESHRTTGINSYSEALYLVKRRYSQTPHLDKVFIFVGTKLLDELKMKEGTLQMGSLNDYRANNPVKTGEYVLWLDGKNKDQNGHEHPGPGKEFLVKRGLKFTVSQVYVKESTNSEYADQIVYTITIIPDMTFTALQAALDLEETYRLTLPFNEDRERQMKIIQEEYIGTDKPLMLIKTGKRFDLVDAL